MASYRERTWFFEQLPKMPALWRIVAMRIYEMWLEARRQGKPLMIRNEILALECSCSVRTVQRATAALVMAGILDKIRRYVKQGDGTMRQIANRYRVMTTPQHRVFRVLHTIQEKLKRDRPDVLKTRGARSDRFMPSETYKRLMSEGLGRSWRTT